MMEKAYGISPEQVIGSAGKQKFVNGPMTAIGIGGWIGDSMRPKLAVDRRQHEE